jgi:hypothetical protein
LLLRAGPTYGILAVVLSGACQPSAPHRVPEQGQQVRPPDSLVISSPRGVEVWFTLARSAKGLDGRQCQERGVEIRRAGTRIAVPLLYTGEPPELLNDSTIRARLWTNCRPGDAYLVDLRTGQPVRERTGRVP